MWLATFDRSAYRGEHRALSCPPNLWTVDKPHRNIPLHGRRGKTVCRVRLEQPCAPAERITRSGESVPGEKGAVGNEGNDEQLAVLDALDSEDALATVLGIYREPEP